MIGRLSIILVLIYALPSFGGDTKQISASCSVNAKDYVLRGSWSDTHPGARLWDVDRILREYKASTPINSCLDDVWAHASAEADEYWTYIGGKWGCLSSDGEPHTQANGQCNSEKLNQVRKNLGYVDSIQLVAVSRIERDCDCSVDDRPQAADLANEIGQALAAAPDQPSDTPEVELDDATLAAIFASGQCENVPESKRRTNINKSGVMARTGSCLLGLAKGIFGSLKSTITGIWDLAKGALGVATGGPEYRALRAAFVGSVGPAMASFFVSPSKAVAKLANNIAQGFSELLENSMSEFKAHWACLSDEARSELMCKSLAYVGTDVALIFAGGAGLVSAVGKSGKLANLTGKVSKGMSAALGEMGMLSGRAGGLFKNLASVAKLSGAKWVTTTKDGVELAVVGGKSFVKKGVEIYEVTSKEVGERIAKLVGSVQKAKQAAETKFVSSLDKRKAALANRAKVTTGSTVRETRAVSPRAPDYKISVKDSSGLIRSAEIRADNVSGAKKLIAEKGLTPKETFNVGGLKYHISDPIEFQGRKAFVAVVENGKTKTIQVYYQSGSQGTFRNLPGVLSDGDEIRWFDKAMGEHGLEVPIDLDRIMNQRAQSIKSVAELTDADVQKLVPSAEDLVELYAKQKGNPVYAIDKSEDLLPTRVVQQDAKRIDPVEVKLANPQMEPNFASGPVANYVAETRWGKVNAEVYRSKNGDLEYLYYKDSEGKVWLAKLSDRTSKLNAAGLPGKSFDGGPMLTPRWEYGGQFPWKFAGESRDGYLDAWNFLKRMPHIERYYLDRGLAVP